MSEDTATAEATEATTSKSYPISTYETKSGTEPVVDGNHEPRTIAQIQDRAINQMMSEIGEGVFVAWTNCHDCRKHANDCKCKAGPKEPPYIVKWRHERFTTDLKLRHRAQRPEHERRLEEDLAADRATRSLKPAVLIEASAAPAVDTSPITDAMSAAADKVAAAKAEVQTPVETEAPTKMAVKEGANREATFAKLRSDDVKLRADTEAVEATADILTEFPHETEKYRVMGLPDDDIRQLLVLKKKGKTDV